MVILALFNRAWHLDLVSWLMEKREWDARSGNRWAKHDSSGIPGMLRYPVWDDLMWVLSGKVTDSRGLATCLLRTLVCTLM